MRNVLFSTALSLSLAAAPLLTGPAIAQQRLQPGGSVQGDLSRGDDQLDTGEFIDVYEVQGRAGQPLSVVMRSDDFDAYLMIRGPGDFTEDNDDSGDDGTNAGLDVRLPADGTYRITATSYEPGESGRYSLSMSGGAGAGRGGAGAYAQASGAGRGPQNAGGGALQPGRSASGALAQGDRRLAAGEFADDWELQVRRGQTYTISLDASDFDSYLMVRGPGGLSEDNDDDPGQRGGRNSRVTFTAVADGVVTVAATSFGTGETGRYQILAEQGGRAPYAGGGRQPQPTYQPPSRQADGSIQLGQTVNGNLGQGDRQLDSGEYINTYTLRGRRGQQLDLRPSTPMSPSRAPACRSSTTTIPTATARWTAACSSPCRRTATTRSPPPAMPRARPAPIASASSPPTVARRRAGRARTPTSRSAVSVRTSRAARSRSATPSAARCSRAMNNSTAASTSTPSPSRAVAASGWRRS